MTTVYSNPEKRTTELYLADREGLLASLDPVQASATQALLAALSQRHAESGAHCWRVARYGLRLAAAVGEWLQLNPSAGSERLFWMPSELLLGALLHDVGKLCVPDAILTKPGRLDAAERRIMEQHVGHGEAIVLGSAALSAAFPIVSAHHEHYNGRGYPYGYAAGEIPCSARMFAICDAYDAMTSNRCYRDAGSDHDARETLRLFAGRQFDPLFVDLFLAIPSAELQQLRMLDSEAQSPGVAE